MENFRLNRLFRLIVLCMAITLHASSQETIDNKVVELMKEGKIPGLSLVIIKDGRPQIRNYGYADLKAKKPVTDSTLFELGSCSKAFTAMAIATLVQEHRLSLDDDVAMYIPWFRVTFKDTAVNITIAQLLHHTSGIPWSTISKIPQTSEKDALEKTVSQLKGQELKYPPGKQYEYATINYDVLALVIQQITQQPFESYLQQNVIEKLHLSNTSIGYPRDSTLKATGYKISFFKPRKFNAPVFKGNNAAGYIISDAGDISRWLQFQMGLTDTAYYDLAAFTHKRDETVPLHGMYSYAMGWDISFDGRGEISHGGLNPNYTSYIVFSNKNKLGVAVLTNSNSPYTPVIGSQIMKLLTGEKIEKEYDPGDNDDTKYSIASIILGIYATVISIFLLLIIGDIFKGKRKYEKLTRSKLIKIILLIIILQPLLYALYILPTALFDFTWEAMIVWTPASLISALILLLTSLGLTCCTYLLSLFFPERNRFKKIIPKLALLSIISGLANMLLIVLVTSSLGSSVALKYLIFYYCLTLTVYLFGRRFVQVNLIRYTMQVIYELRMKIADRIFATSYQKFERIDRGRVYTAMNDDVNTIADSANLFVVLVTSLFTVIGALLYLASIAFWATIVTFLMILTLTTLYFFVSRSTNPYFEAARDSSNLFMRLINGMIDGFKEISLQRNKKEEYKQDISATADEYRRKISTASIRFINASSVGEATLIIILGVVAFAFPKLFPGIKDYILMSFIIVVLYLIGPVNTVLNSVPGAMRLRIAIRRIQQFLNNIPSDIDETRITTPTGQAHVDSIKAEGVTFRYDSVEEATPFAIGPIDLEIKKGEIIFIVGGNGSGKTTFARLLTGLYEPETGTIRINDKTVMPGQLGEHFSAVFSPMYLFEKLYNINVKEKKEELKHYLKILDLDHKVEIKGNTYSTTNLSGGQRKRLALLQCYLEDPPIYLFDEWAADQDPAYRFFFYRTLLPRMKMAGKIVIAITHDDHYFDAADKVYKMDQGKLSLLESHSLNIFGSITGNYKE